MIAGQLPFLLSCWEFRQNVSSLDLIDIEALLKKSCQKYTKLSSNPVLFESVFQTKQEVRNCIVQAPNVTS